MKLTDVKPELVVRLVGQRDFVLEEEEDSKEAAQRFLDGGIGLKLWTQMVDYSERLTIELKAISEMYIGKTHPVNSVLSWRSHKTQKEAQEYARQTKQQCRDQRQRYKCRDYKRRHVIEKTN